MPPALRARLTFANVTSVIALFVALGGSAAAIPGVVGKQSRVIDRQGRVKACYVKKGRDRGELRLLARGRCKRGQERPIRWAKQGPPGNPGQPGAPGARGPKGDTGEQGPQGAAGATDVVVRTADSTAGTGANTSETVVAQCEPGEVAVGGGGSPVGVPNSDMVFMKTRPSPNSEGDKPTAWSATIVTEISDPDGFARAYVVCAAP